MSVCSLGQKFCPEHWDNMLHCHSAGILGTGRSKPVIRIISIHQWVSLAAPEHRGRAKASSWSYRARMTTFRPHQELRPWRKIVLHHPVTRTCKVNVINHQLLIDGMRKGEGLKFGPCIPGRLRNSLWTWWWHPAKHSSSLQFAHISHSICTTS